MESRGKVPAAGVAGAVQLRLGKSLGRALLASVVDGA